jgi:hypothetical protein
MNYRIVPFQDGQGHHWKRLLIGETVQKRSEKREA